MATAQKIFRAAVPLLAGMLVAVVVVREFADFTRGPIAVSKQRQVMEQIATAMPLHYDNDLSADVIELRGSGPTTFAHRAKVGETTVGAVLVTESPDGYNGPIRLAIGVTEVGEILAVRILEHRETPGLGNGIHQRVSDWILTFNGRALAQMQNADWQVRRHGGVFDALSGATVSPAAVVRAVHQSLQLFESQQHQLFPGSAAVTRSSQVSGE